MKNRLKKPFVSIYTKVLKYFGFNQNIWKITKLWYSRLYPIVVVAKVSIDILEWLN